MVQIKMKSLLLRPAAVMVAESLIQLAVSCDKFGQRVALEKLVSCGGKYFIHFVDFITGHSIRCLSLSFI